MGCGRHWPGCNGQLIPDVITAEVLIEFSHRLVTGAVGILIVALQFGHGVHWTCPRNKIFIIQWQFFS